VQYQLAVGTAQVPSGTLCYRHSPTIVGFVGYFNVSLIQFPITSNLYPNSSSTLHQAHGKTLVLKKGSLGQDSDSSVYLGASQTNKQTIEFFYLGKNLSNRLIFYKCVTTGIM
jgi:hypothetical protein